MTSRRSVGNQQLHFALPDNPRGALWHCPQGRDSLASVPRFLFFAWDQTHGKKGQSELKLEQPC